MRSLRYSIPRNANNAAATTTTAIAAAATAATAEHRDQDEVTLSRVFKTLEQVRLACVVDRQNIAHMLITCRNDVNLAS